MPSVTEVVPLGALTALRYARLARGLTQAEVERRAGLSATQLSHYEAGRRRPDAAARFRLAQVLDVDVDVIFPPWEGHVR